MTLTVNWSLLLALVACLHSGCIALAAGAAGGAAGTAYVLGRVEEDLEAPVATIYESARAACRDLDLAVIERQGDQHSALIEAEFTDGMAVHVSIQEIAGGRSSLTIRVGVVGNEDRARQVWDAMRRHLPRSAWSREKREGEKGRAHAADTEPMPRGRQ